ncbi:adenylate/guanylate cyclase domain-containing protein [Labrenzia sp. DG1229]|uniref:adenylate/guanylate cyclase domain-containing protein n=1 Tax=Labrenzia sp. DG1229 TaxID=681847 RepID=UPI000A0660A2|nr:adenylate/guanylate cyclase domain-containing protein [Labrenzia sp. DG1229]
MISTSYSDILTLGTGLLRVNKAVLFADVVDSVRLFEVDEEGTIVRWIGFVDDLERRLSVSGQGRLVKRMGDGLLAEFDDVSFAARTALDIQDAIRKVNENLGADRRIELRIGLDVGEILHSSDQDLYGQHVNTAARLSAASRAGQIIVSAAIRNVLASDPDSVFEDLGELHLKNLSQPVSAFLLRSPDEVPNPSPRIAAKDLQPTIAVLPLMSPTVSQETMIWSNLITEDLVGALARSPALSVISNLSTANFRAKPVELEDIRTKLSADFIVTGSFRHHEGMTLLDLEVVETRTGLVVLSQRLEFDTSELLQQNTIFSDLANNVHAALLNREMKRALSAPIPSLEGYAILFGAIALLNRLSHQDFNLAGELLTGLIERIPNAPTALAWKARWHVLKVQQGWAEDPGLEARLALDCTGRALDIDPQNSGALVAEGFVRNNLLHDLEEAEELFDCALEMTPNDATGRALRAGLHTFRGEGPQAANDAERALHLAPLDPNRFFFQAMAAGANLANKDNARALELASSSLRLNRSHTSTLRIKAVAEWRLGKTDEARKTLAKLLKKQPNFTVSWWRQSSPAADYEMGRAFACSLKELGVPE